MTSALMPGGFQAYHEASRRDLRERHAEKARESFRYYCQEAVHHLPSELGIDPPGSIQWGRRYQDPDEKTACWYLDAITDHVEAWGRGDFRFLVINVRNKSFKSGIGAVLFPTWIWVPRAKSDPMHHGPRKQFFTGGHAMDLAIAQCRESREVLSSGWWQDSFGPAARTRDRLDWSWWDFSGDQNTKSFYTNTLGGHRVTAWPPAGTGKKMNLAIIDDSLGIDQADSDTFNDRSNNWVFRTVWSRMNDPRKAGICNIQHRLRKDDTSAEFVDRLGYWFQGGEVVVLNLPLEYKPRMFLMKSSPQVRLEDTPPTPIGWTDPRTEEGESLDPVRWTPKVIEQDKRSLGAIFEALCNQDPQKRSDTVIKAHWKWKPRWPTPPDPRKGYIIQSWDCGLKGLDPTKSGAVPRKRSLTVGWVLQVIGGKMYLLDRFGGVPMNIPEMLDEFRRAQEAWPNTLKIYVEDKAGGSTITQTMSSIYPGIIPVDPDKKGGKWQRFAAVADVYLKNGAVLFPPEGSVPWIGDVLKYIEEFPGGDWDDDVDALSQALSEEWLPSLDPEAIKEATAGHSLKTLLASY